MRHFYLYLKSNQAFQAECFKHIVVHPLAVGGATMFSMALGDWLLRTF